MDVVTTSPDACVFCKLRDNSPDKYGEMITIDELTVHYFCLLLSAGVYQRGAEHEGIYGFLLDDIKQEVRRSSRLRCTGCKKTGASIACCVRTCRKTVHFPCAKEQQFIFQFTGSFPAYCKQHSPRQLVSCDASLPQSCSVCLDALEPLLSYFVLKCPCCLNSWFHRDCIQRQALSAGLFLFRCSLCNNKEQFQQEMLRLGVHTPERDASWELEENAYTELLQVYQHCDARKCFCHGGRNATTKTGWFQIMRCETCGSRGTHRKCSSLKLYTSTWACEDCSAALQGKASLPDPRLLDTHRSGGQRKDLKRRLNPNHKERAERMNGRVIPHTPLAVDFWQVRKCLHVRLFFLSHMHSDHTAGLTSTWSHRPIYCSAVTATLLKLKLQVKEQWIHPLELGEPYLLPLDDIGKERMTVTLMDANHCPGAVMFLFQGYFGTVLYTGDFRYSPSMLRESCLRTNTTIDVLYLDNTNCDPTRTLPSRQQATQQIKEIIRQHPGHKVVIGLYKLGKESLLVNLALEFKTWVEVSHERLETLRALELPDVFTTEPGAGRIRAVDQSQVSRANLALWNREEPTLAILPTSRPMVSYHPGVHVVPYSDHSSYQELADFVSALRPTSLLPIVGACVPSFSALLPRRKRHEVLVPESVRKYMAARPEVQAPAPAGLHRPQKRPRRSAPRGVVFESPGRSSRPSSLDCAWETLSLEEEEVEVEGEDADCILMDLTRERTPPGERAGAGGLWNLNAAQRVSEEMELRATQEMEMMGSLPFTQSNFAPVEIQSHTAASLRPRGLADAERLPRDSATASTCATESDDFSPRNGIADEEEDGVAPSRTSSDDDSATLTVTRSLGQARSRLTEECEEELLLHLPLSEEDMSGYRTVLDKSLVETLRLAPYYVVRTGNGALCC